MNDIRNVGCLSKEYASCLLNLSNPQSFHTNTKKVDLQSFPFPTFLFLAVIKFDVLHSLNKLYNLTLFRGRHIETFYVKFPPIFHEVENPQYIETISKEKDAEYHRIIIRQYNREYHKISNRKHHTHRVTHEKRFDTSMISYTLHDITSILCVEKNQRHVCQFDKEV